MEKITSSIRRGKDSHQQLARWCILIPHRDGVVFSSYGDDLLHKWVLLNDVFAFTRGFFVNYNLIQKHKRERNDHCVCSIAGWVGSADYLL